MAFFKMTQFEMRFLAELLFLQDEDDLFKPSTKGKQSIEDYLDGLDEFKQVEKSENDMLEELRTIQNETDFRENLEYF